MEQLAHVKNQTTYNTYDTRYLTLVIVWHVKRHVTRLILFIQTKEPSKTFLSRLWVEYDLTNLLSHFCACVTTKSNKLFNGGLICLISNLEYSLDRSFFSQSSLAVHKCSTEGLFCKLSETLGAYIHGGILLT